VYPNPIYGECSFEFQSPENCNATIGIFDLTGKLITSSNEQLVVGRQTYKISGISTGLYILNISSVKFSVSAKIVSKQGSLNKAEIKHISVCQAVSEDERVIPEYNKKSQKTTNTLYSMGYSTGDVVVAEAKGSAHGNPYGYVAIVTVDPTASSSVVFDFVPCVDSDGTYYPIVKIGTQVWMAENLNTTKYNDGTPISKVTGDTDWANLNYSAYCWYDNDSLKYSTTYGALYNWYAINSGKLCPIGWHAPSQHEWSILNTYLGGELVAGGKLKEEGTTHWLSPNTGATNITRFTALPGGYRDIYGIFNGLGVNGNWWLSTAVSEGSSKFTIIIAGATYAFNTNNFNKTNGLSVRCIKN
jgi:uncharacterized protein (TIGR02145 family)